MPGVDFNDNQRAGMVLALKYSSFSRHLDFGIWLCSGGHKSRLLHLIASPALSGLSNPAAPNPKQSQSTTYQCSRRLQFGILESGFASSLDSGIWDYDSPVTIFCSKQCFWVIVPRIAAGYHEAMCELASAASGADSDLPMMAC